MKKVKPSETWIFVYDDSTGFSKSIIKPFDVFFLHFSFHNEAVGV